MWVWLRKNEHGHCMHMRKNTHFLTLSAPVENAAKCDTVLVTIVPNPPDLLPPNRALKQRNLLTPESDCSVIANCPNLGCIIGGLSPSRRKEASPSTSEAQKLRTATELGS
jgi:hypothetical protein